MKTGLVAVLLLASTSLASAADLYVSEAEVVVDGMQPGWRGNVEIGGLGRYVISNEDGLDFHVEDGFTGVYGAADFWADTGSFKLGLDGYVEWLGFNEDDEDLIGTLTSIVGLHAGVDLDGSYVGAFGALAMYPNADDEEFYLGGAVGIEATADLGDAQVFGRLGWAEAPNEDYDGLEGYHGPFVEGGATYALSDELAVLGKAGYGYATTLDGEDEDGYYVNWGAKVAYQPGDLGLAFVASYEGLRSTDLVDDEEWVEDHTVKLGISVPLGGGTAVDALKPLASPSAPFRASVHGDVM